MYALQFDERPDDSDLVKRAYQRPNMIVIGPSTGIIGGRRAAWAPVESPSFMNRVFELKAIASADNGENADAKTGVMKIGDFASFCDFLESMTVD